MDEFCKELQAQVDLGAEQRSSAVIEKQVTQLTRARTMITSERNIDKIVEDMIHQPWTYSHVFFQLARDEDESLDSLADLHSFNRLLVSRAPDVVQKYVVRQGIPTKRAVQPRTIVRQILNSWFKSSDKDMCDHTRLFDEWRALAFFELLLLVFAPTIVRSDAWIQYITQNPVAWMAHRHVRLLTTPKLLMLLRSNIGRDILEQLEHVEWASPIMSTLQQLRVPGYKSMYEQGFEPTIKITDDGQVQLFVITAHRY